MPWKIEVINYKDGEEEKTLKVISTDNSGSPIWIHEKDGKEVAVDAKHFFKKIPELIEEKRELKNEKNSIEQEYKEFKAKFEDIEDPQKAVEAIKMVKSLEGKDLIESKKVEQLKSQLKDEYDKAIEKERKTTKEIIEDLTKKLETEKGHNFNLTVSNAFKGSKILNGSDSKVRVPVDMIEKYWGGNFKAEEVNGKLRPIGYFQDGKPIYSDSKPGELASFDEAILKLINISPFKSDILKGKQQTGGGIPIDGSSKNVEVLKKDISSYKYISDFKSQKEKQQYIETYGLDKYKDIIRNSRGNVQVGQLSDMNMNGK